MLNQKEVGLYIALFNRGGYVLDFSTADFDSFTMQSIGVPLCCKYERSKGKSLIAFIDEASNEDVQRLLFDLLAYYELNYSDEFCDSAEGSISYGHDRKFRTLYLKCKEISNRELSDSSITSSCEFLKREFSSEYMSKQIDNLMTLRVSDPFEAIGKAKELVESCCKTILESQDIDVDKNWSVAKLSKETAKVLNVDSDNVDDSNPESQTVKQILGSLQNLVDGVSRFRNSHGSGHGRSTTFVELPARHAKLAVGSAVTLCEYYWETYEWKKSKRQLK